MSAYDIKHQVQVDAALGGPLYPPLNADEIDTVHTMRAAGCSIAAIAAFLSRSERAVRRHCRGEDDHNRWDTPPAPDRDLRARWEARMPAMREAMRVAGAQP